MHKFEGYQTSQISQTNRTGGLLKSIQPVIDRWLFVKAKLRDNIAL